MQTIDISSPKTSLEESIVYTKFSFCPIIPAPPVLAIHVSILPLPKIGTCGWWLREFVVGIFGAAAVPFFFVQSGYYLAKRIGEPNWWRKAIHKRTKTLLVPYLLWSVLFFLFGLIICYAISLRTSHSLSTEKWMYLPWLYRHGGTSIPRTLFGWNLKGSCLLAPLWYIRSLMLLVVLSPVIIRLLRSFGVSFLVVLFALCWFLRLSFESLQVSLISKQWFFFWRFGLSLDALFWFSAGLFLRFTSLTITKRFALLSLVVAIVFSFESSFCHRLSVPSYLHGDLLHVPFLMVACWGLLPPIRPPSWLSSLSFPVYLSHMFVIEVLRRFPGLKNDNAVVLVIYYSATLVLTTIFAMLLQKLSPRFSNLAFGGRTPHVRL